MRSESIEEPSARERYEPGSEADFERLYRNTYHRILGTLITMVRDRATAEDCAQETFERAYRNWASWRPDAPVEAWLHRIAINVAISDRRHQSLGQAGELIRRLGRPAPGPDPSTVAERSELVRALKKLPPKQAAALVLRYYHGYSNREIGAALGVPEQTVASRLGAARKQLQAVLGRER
ncbi:MAG: RNA polymerase sigma factor [Chloroflexi bacterium]|nr:MAG: RNA polymerase sigma factor [Chloroflexota bacterium]TMG16138.1 MAG: RNA polymerase sigma factor [Chloroflexota bacterium]TMG67527.1 MAG: RNA polymerase sigma factor [Chloroflexota bacterium]